MVAELSIDAITAAVAILQSGDRCAGKLELQRLWNDGFETDPYRRCIIAHFLADTEEELLEHYEAIVRESERLSWLVDNVLNYSAIERDSKHYVLRRHDVNETVQRVVDSLQATLSMRDVEIELRLDPYLPFLRLLLASFVVLEL